MGISGYLCGRPINLLRILAAKCNSSIFLRGFHNTLIIAIIKFMEYPLMASFKIKYNFNSYPISQSSKLFVLDLEELL